MVRHLDPGRAGRKKNGARLRVQFICGNSAKYEVMGLLPEKGMKYLMRAQKKRYLLNLMFVLIGGKILKGFVEFRY